MDPVIRAREKQLDNDYVEIFSRYSQFEHLIPMPPNVLVRILPKEQMSAAGIYITGNDNKPVYEGIVLRTWEPREYDGYELKSDLQPGDHVLFPHFAGQPIGSLDTDKYRAIPEGVSKRGKFIFGNDVGCIIGKVNYQMPSVEEIFTSVFEKAWDKCTLEGSVSEDMLRMLRAEFDIIPKIKGSRTLSGR